MLFDDDNGYTPEYIYGNYFERIQLPNNNSSTGSCSINKSRACTRDGDDEEKEKVVGNLGLRELIDGRDGDLGRTRVLHRNINAGSSSRFV